MEVFYLASTQISLTIEETKVLYELLEVGISESEGRISKDKIEIGERLFADLGEVLNLNAI